MSNLTIQRGPGRQSSDILGDQMCDTFWSAVRSAIRLNQPQDSLVRDFSIGVVSVVLVALIAGSIENEFALRMQRAESRIVGRKVAVEETAIAEAASSQRPETRFGKSSDDNSNDRVAAAAQECEMRKHPPTHSHRSESLTNEGSDGKQIGRYTTANECEKHEDLQAPPRQSATFIRHNSEEKTIKPIAKANSRPIVSQQPDRRAKIRYEYFNHSCNKGRTYLRIQDHARAAEAFTLAIKVNPSSSMAFQNRGIAHYHDHKYRAAISDLNRAIELQPENVGALSSLSWILATCPKEFLRDGLTALKLANKACQLSEEVKYWRSLGSLAAAYARIGDFDGAARSAKESLELAPESEHVRCRQWLELYRSKQPLIEAAGSGVLASS